MKTYKILSDLKNELLLNLHEIDLDYLKELKLDFNIIIDEIIEELYNE